MAVIVNLRLGGPTCLMAADCIEQLGLDLGFSKQRNTGARWTAGGNIELDSDRWSNASDPSNPVLLGYVVHEVQHIKDGPALALSVEGEVRGWQAEIVARDELGSEKPDTAGNPLQTIRDIPDNPSNEDLKRARKAMQTYAGPGYLIWALGLRPSVGTRIVDAVLRRLPGSSWR